MRLTQEEALAVEDTIQQAADDCLLAKRQDYSGKEDPYANFRMSEFVGVEPWRGVMVRLMDKLSRVRHIMESGEVLVKDESIKDTLGDVINYTKILGGLIFESTEDDLDRTPDKEWLREKADAEDECGPVSAGYMVDDGS